MLKRIRALLPLEAHRKDRPGYPLQIKGSQRISDLRKSKKRGKIKMLKDNNIKLHPLGNKPSIKNSHANNLQIPRHNKKQEQCYKIISI